MELSKGDLRQLLENLRLDDVERLLGVLLHARQDVQNLVQVGEAPPGREVIQVRTDREQVNQILLPRHEVGDGRRDGDGAFEAVARRLGRAARDMGVEDDGDAEEVFVAVLAHDGPAEPRGGAPVDVAEIVAVAVLAVADVLEGLADAGGQGNAAGVVAPAGGQLQPRQSLERGIDHQLLPRLEAARGVQQPEGLIGLHAVAVEGIDAPAQAAQTQAQAPALAAAEGPDGDALGGLRQQRMGQPMGNDVDRGGRAAPRLLQLDVHRQHLAGADAPRLPRRQPHARTQQPHGQQRRRPEPEDVRPDQIPLKAQRDAAVHGEDDAGPEKPASGGGEAVAVDPPEPAEGGAPE